MIYLVGKGGHSGSVQEVLIEYEPDNFTVILAEEMEKLPNDIIKDCNVSFFIGIGDIHFRNKVARFISSKTGKFKTIISSLAHVSNRCSLGQGTIIMPGACVRYDAVIGDHCVVNTGAIIEHECQIGDLTNISPSVTLCGKVIIESRVEIGAGVTVLPGIRIGSDIVVGAGSTVVSDLLQPGIYIGSPAMKKR